MTVFWRYWLLQVPGWFVLGGLLAVATRLWRLPVWGAVALFGAWLVKDALLYPWLAKHYERREAHAHEAYLGESAVAQEALEPTGYVRLRGGELWKAELDAGESPVPAGANVTVSRVEGLTLRVRR